MVGLDTDIFKEGQIFLDPNHKIIFSMSQLIHHLQLKLIRLERNPDQHTVITIFKSYQKSVRETLTSEKSGKHGKRQSYHQYITLWAGGPTTIWRL